MRQLYFAKGNRVYVFSGEREETGWDCVYSQRSEGKVTGIV